MHWASFFISELRNNGMHLAFEKKTIKDPIRKSLIFKYHSMCDLLVDTRH